jgi:hypothetical protein
LLIKTAVEATETTQAMTKAAIKNLTLAAAAQSFSVASFSVASFSEAQKQFSVSVFFAESISVTVAGPEAVDTRFFCK